MAFLSIAGIDVASLSGTQVAGATERAPEFASGEATRAFAGNLRATTRGEKRSWQFTLARMAPANLATLRAAIVGGKFVTVTGDFIAGASITAQVVLGDVAYRKLTYPAGSLGLVPTLTITEV